MTLLNGAFGCLRILQSPDLSGVGCVWLIVLEKSGPQGKKPVESYGKPDLPRTLGIPDHCGKMRLNVPYSGCAWLLVLAKPGPNGKTQLAAPFFSCSELLKIWLQLPYELHDLRARDCLSRIRSQPDQSANSLHHGWQICLCRCPHVPLSPCLSANIADLSLLCFTVPIHSATHDNMLPLK